MTVLEVVDNLVAGRTVDGIPVQYLPLVEMGLNSRPGSYTIDVEIWRGKATLTPKVEPEMMGLPPAGDPALFAQLMGQPLPPGEELNLLAGLPQEGI